MSSLPPAPVPLGYASVKGGGFASTRRLSRAVQILLAANMVVGLLGIVSDDWQSGTAPGVPSQGGRDASTGKCQRSACSRDWWAGRDADAGYGCRVLDVGLPGHGESPLLFQSAAGVHPRRGGGMVLLPDHESRFVSRRSSGRSTIAAAIRNVRYKSTPAVVGWWWACWIVAGLTQGAANAMVYNAVPLDELWGNMDGDRR